MSNQIRDLVERSVYHFAKYINYYFVSNCYNIVIVTGRLKEDIPVEVDRGVCDDLIIYVGRNVQKSHTIERFGTRRSPLPSSRTLDVEFFCVFIKMPATKVSIIFFFYFF